MTDWTRPIRDVADFPKPGIVFKDIMPMLADPVAFAGAIEARGFLFGAPLARVLGAGIVPVRKPGKLPGRVLEQRYALEYGEDALQVQADAVSPGTRVLLVDDVLATGGTLAATRLLAERLEAEVVGAEVLIELGFLNGRARWNGSAPLHAALLV